MGNGLHNRSVFHARIKSKPIKNCNFFFSMLLLYCILSFLFKMLLLCFTIGTNIDGSADVFVYEGAGQQEVNFSGETTDDKLCRFENSAVCIFSYVFQELVHKI